MRSMIYNAPIIDRTLEPRVTQSLACVPAGSADVATDPLSWSTVSRPLFDANQAIELHGYFSMEPQEVASADHSNQQYSITAVTTSAGAIAERYAYSAYGEPTICDASGAVIASSAINNRYSYTGREWDATVGLYHFRARWMSPKTGRFLQRDPIKYVGSEWNLTEFVRGRVLIGLDPSGLDRPCPKILEPKPINPCKLKNWEEYVANGCMVECTPITTGQLPWSISVIGGQCQSAALECANNAFPTTPTDQNPINNQAVRHCTTTALMRCKLGKLCTRCIANQREMWQRMCGSQPCSQTLRGIDNNNHGIDDSNIRCGSECSDCVNALRNGKLATNPELLDPVNPDPRCKDIPAPFLPRPGVVYE